MSAKDTPRDVSATTRPNRTSRRQPAQLDSASLTTARDGGRNVDAESHPSTSSAPHSAATPALVHQPDVVSSDSETEPREPDSPRDPASGPARRGSAREKRKRSRVTPEQLIHLESLFAADRSPSATRRREISHMLGMNERQTQIWFQNRRAKAKMLDGKKEGFGAEEPPNTPPELSRAFEPELYNLLHEDEPITMIPCAELTIGTFRRVAAAVGKNDLIAYMCESRRCLAWYIHASGYGFKMEIPFDTIVKTEFINAAPGSGLAIFDLSRPPLFFHEIHISPGIGRPRMRQWKPCADWTEGQQATQVLRHTLMGSAVQLASILRMLEVSTMGASSVPLTLLSRRESISNMISLAPAPAQPPAPMYRGVTDILRAEDYSAQGHGRKRSYSGPAMTGSMENDTGFASSDLHASVPQHPPSASFGSQSFANPRSQSSYAPSYPPVLRSGPAMESPYYPPSSAASDSAMSTSSTNYQSSSGSSSASFHDYEGGAYRGPSYHAIRRLSHTSPLARPTSSLAPSTSQSHAIPTLITNPLYPIQQQPSHPGYSSTHARSDSGSTTSGMPTYSYEQDDTTPQ